MAHRDVNDEVLQSVGPDRRDFLKLVLGGTAFAIPLMASFSLDGLSFNEAGAQLAPNQTFYPNQCQPDPGYVGPRRFSAHIWDQSGGGSRVNGEAAFHLQEQDHRPPHTPELKTDLTISPGAGSSFLVDSYVAVNSQRVADLPLGKGKITTVSSLCDFGALLEAMAAEQAYVVVVGYDGIQQVTLMGTIRPDSW